MRLIADGVNGGLATAVTMTDDLSRSGLRHLLDQGEHKLNDQ
jgi:hypothetical protein